MIRFVLEKITLATVCRMVLGGKTGRVTREEVTEEVKSLQARERVSEIGSGDRERGVETHLRYSEEYKECGAVRRASKVWISG